jgi:orotidine 5'-phosphate decarboxylase subfamily 2
LTRFADRVAELNDERGHLCVGIDPRPSRSPAEYEGPDGLERWCLDLVEATAEHAAAFKPNLAFYLAMGPEGIQTLQAVVDRANELGALTILDGKFEDIGSTSRAYARFAAETLDADAVTVSPYMGTDVLDAFQDHDVDLFVLSRTTNPSAPEIQDPVTGRVIQAFSPHDVGFVAPGNDAEVARHVRQSAGGSPLLLPGIGSQGGKAGQAAQTAGSTPFLIAVGRAIAHADGTFPKSAAEAAAGFVDEIEAAD